LLYIINDIIINISNKTNNNLNNIDFTDKLIKKYKEDYENNFKVDYNSYINEIEQFTNIKIKIEIIK
jgi:hypothetical protein